MLTAVRGRPPGCVRWGRLRDGRRSRYRPWRQVRAAGRRMGWPGSVAGPVETRSARVGPVPRCDAWCRRYSQWFQGGEAQVRGGEGAWFRPLFLKAQIGLCLSRPHVHAAIGAFQASCHAASNPRIIEATATSQGEQGGGRAWPAASAVAFASRMAAQRLPEAPLNRRDGK